MTLRERFPLLASKTYLNSCSQGALSIDVRAAYEEYLQDWDEKGSPWELWVERMNSARIAFATLVNADPDEIAVLTSASHAVSALASSLEFPEGRNKIVVSDFEFPTVAQIWHAQESRGARIVHVPAAGNTISMSSMAEAIDDDTLLVSITHVSFRTGSRQDIAEVVRLAHSHGAFVLLDSYQALGTFPIDVRELGVDFLVGGVLKYLLSSAGLAYLYVRKDLLPLLNPTMVGWFAQQNIFAMDIYAHTPSPTARKFEAGTPPVPNIYAALAGMQLVQQVGIDAIERQIGELTGAIIEGALRRGFNLVTPVHPDQHGALITLRSHKVDLLVKLLEEDDVITSSRDDYLRVSPHFYNNQGDIDRLMDCLEEHKELLV